MPKEKPDWEKLEIICAEIQKQLEPNAVVRHNHCINGIRTGRKRKLDISISHTISSYPIFIIIDCKKHKKPVEMKDVYAFAGQVEDVNANLGIMISTSGFDAGATAVAMEKNIILRKYRMPNEQDWKHLLKNSWSFITVHDVKMKEAFVTIANVKLPISQEIYIFNDKEENKGTIYEIFSKIWKSPELPKNLGEIVLEIFPETNPIFIREKETQKFIEVQHLMAKLVISAKKYPVNLTLATGNILEDYQTGKAIYQEYISEGFEWKEIINTQQGIDITPEQYEEDKKIQNLTTEITESEKFLRLIVNKKS